MIDHNILKKITYIIAYPVALFFFKLKISANTVTFISVGMSIMAGISLLLNLHPVYFIFFWILNILLDFSDGTVARLSGKKSISILRVDHMSDLLKYGIIWISAGISYSDNLVWISAFACCFIHLYFNIISHDYNNYIKSLNKKNVTRLNYFTFNRKNLVLKNLYELFFTIDGHSLFIFLLLPLSRIHACFILIYFSLLSLLRALIIIYKFKKINYG